MSNIERVVVQCAEDANDRVRISYSTTPQQDGYVAGLNCPRPVTLDLAGAKELRDALNDCIAVYCTTPV